MTLADVKYMFKDLFKSKGFMHISFWILLYLFLILIDRTKDYPLWMTMIRRIIDIFFFVLIVYINILYLSPQFLQKKKPFIYLLILAGMVLIVSPIYTFTIFLFYQPYPEDQYYIRASQSILALICLFVAVSSTLYKILSDWLVHQTERMSLERQTLQSELKFLKSQINPHFFFNTLNNLYALTLKKSDLAPEIVLRLSEMMRYMLYESNEKMVSLDKEVNYVKNYLELEKLRQGHKFDINFHMSGIVKDQKIAPLLFIPFLENSFKHGLDNQIKSGYVNIDLQLNDKDITMSIENTKPPTLPIPVNGQKKKKSGGIGLENVKRRLKLLYPQKHKLSIQENPHTFKVELNIELT